MMLGDRSYPQTQFFIDPVFQFFLFFVGEAGEIRPHIGQVIAGADPAMLSQHRQQQIICRQNIKATQGVFFDKGADIPGIPAFQGSTGMGAMVVDSTAPGFVIITARPMPTCSRYLHQFDRYRPDGAGQRIMDQFPFSDRDQTARRQQTASHQLDILKMQGGAALFTAFPASFTACLQGRHRFSRQWRCISATLLSGGHLYPRPVKGKRSGRTTASPWLL
jgi:hypothetical protein